LSIVTVALELTIELAFEALLKFTENVSFGSTVLSPFMETLNVADVANAGMVSVPELAT
jgi:hypothetical protein